MKFQTNLCIRRASIMRLLLIACFSLAISAQAAVAAVDKGISFGGLMMTSGNPYSANPVTLDQLGVITDTALNNQSLASEQKFDFIGLSGIWNRSINCRKGTNAMDSGGTVVQVPEPKELMFSGLGAFLVHLARRRLCRRI